MKMFKIEEIVIKNFRSISNARINMSRFTVFVGNNDAGKSNVLKSLNLFFNGETDHNTKFNFEDDFCKLAKVGAKQASEITISITISLPDSYSDKKVIWTKIWRRESLGNAPHSDDIKNESKKLGRFTKAFLRGIAYRYVPTIKSETYFQYLLGELYDSIAESTSSKFSESSSGFANTVQTVTQDMSANIKKQLGLESKLIIDFADFFRTLKFQTAIDENNKVSLKQRGDGVRTRHIPAILYFIHKNTVDSKTKGSVPHNTIWGYEEPETAIELSKCFEFANDFLGYSDKIHIFITTHSPAFYSLAEKEENAKCFFAVNNGNGTVFEEENIENVHNHLGLIKLIAPLMAEKHEELIRAKEELLRIENEVEELRKKTNPIVYVEGKTDKMYLEKYMNLCSIDLGIDIIDGEGKNKMDGKFTAWKSHCSIINSQIIFLYDCDVNKKEEDVDNKLFVRVASHNENEKVYTVGAENLLNLSDEFNYNSFKTNRESKPSSLGEINIIQEVDKVKLAKFICESDEALEYLKNWGKLVEKIKKCLCSD